MLRYTSRVRWQDKMTNEEVRRRCGLENLEHRVKKISLRWFGLEMPLLQGPYGYAGPLWIPVLY